MNLRPFAFVLLFMMLGSAHIAADIRTLLAKSTVRAGIFLRFLLIHI
jgi:hypothetical protein